MSYLGRILFFPLVIPGTAFAAVLPLSCTLHASQHPAVLAALDEQAFEQHWAEDPLLPEQGVQRRVPKLRGQGKDR